MANNRCPLCGQPLPEAMTQDQITAGIQKLASPVLVNERKRLEEEFETRLLAEKEIARQRAERDLHREISEAKKQAKKAEEEKDKQLKELDEAFKRRLEIQRDTARRQAERELKREIDAAQKRVAQAEAESAKRVQLVERDTEQRLRKEMAQAVRTTTRETELKLETLQTQREKERLRHEAEMAKLQGQLDTLSRRLEKQTGEQIGEEGELDLYQHLRQTFPGDRIERIGRGVKGADVVQHVMDGGNSLGRIVYESKNVSTWQNGFITQAEKYRTQYETPYVMVVTRVFPRKERDFCVVDTIPVLRPRMAMALSNIIREGIVEIGRLRLSAAGRDQKAHQLIEYI
ncbi:MAG: DUF2130 domain-containing protein, partial [Terriglobales bacterium]